MSESTSILILTTDAGSGHRTAAQALELAIAERYGDAARVRVSNPWHHPQAPAMWRRYEELYLDELQSAPKLYDLSYALSELPGVAQALSQGVAGLLESSIQPVLDEFPADLVISVYPLFTAAVASCCGGPRARPRLLTVVTDLGAVHRSWFTSRGDLCAVPTATARRKAIRCGLDPRIVVTTGIPVDPRFGRPRADAAALRRELGWRPDLTALLLLGGGAGVGQLAELAQAIDAAGLPLQLAVVAGKNEELAGQLRAHPWRTPTEVYGFVDLPDLMHAADIVATKAGGLTVSEALAAGRPLLIHGNPPGQESGNLLHLERFGAGCWTPDADALVSRLAQWLRDPELLRFATTAARQIGRPDAAYHIAELGWGLAHGPPDAGRAARNGRFGPHHARRPQPQIGQYDAEPPSAGTT